MADIRVLGAAELHKVLSLDDVLAGVQRAYLAKAQGCLLYTSPSPRD